MYFCFVGPRKGYWQKKIPQSVSLWVYNFSYWLGLCSLHRGDQPVPADPRFSHAFEATTPVHIRLFWQIKKQICDWQKHKHNILINSATTDGGKFDYSCEFEHCSCSD
jgi:hypothetical protein